MLSCFNPACDETNNPPGSKFCMACGAPLFLKEKYWGTSLLGHGGFGRTFTGFMRRSPGAEEQPCAIKQLYIPQISGPTRDKIIELFERESKWLYQLEEHPQTPKFIDYFAEGDHLYLIQELIVGDTLTTEIKKKTPYSEGEVLDFLEEANQILKYIHNYKIIHRDIKPDNFIRRQADNKQADNKWVLIDFGASRILSETALMGGATVIGTPEYMAPEQNRGKIVPASDLYSLGVICVQLITGQPTIEMFDLQTNRWLWTKFLPKDQQVSKSFVSLINDLISPSLGDRLESTLQVDQRLKRIRHRKKIGTLSNFIPPNSGFVPKANYVNPDQQPTTPLIKPNPLNANTYSPQKKSSSEKPYPLDSKQLASYLKWRRWQAADGETWRLINESLGKSPNYFLFPQDLPLIPCNVLQEIDRLWLEYSKNRFGFSPQLRVYQKFGGEYPLFCQELGWPMVPSARQPERDYQYKTKAPLGHLPSRRQMGGSALWKNAKAFYQRLTECDVV